MNITKRTVINWIKTLEKEKYIHIISTGRGKVNKIYPLWNYSNVSTTSDTDDTSKAVFSGETDCTSEANCTSKADCTSEADCTSKAVFSGETDCTSEKSCTQLVNEISPKDKYIELNNNIYANDICVSASHVNAQNENTQNAKETPTQKEASDTLELLFAEWYSSYPRKQDKQRAKKAFLKVMKLTGKKEKDTFGEYAGKSPAEKVAMMKQVATRQARETEPQYIPYPSTWLNGCRWQDSTDTAPTANSTEGYSKAYADEFGV